MEFASGHTEVYRSVALKKGSLLKKPQHVRCPPLPKTSAVSRDRTCNMSPLSGVVGDGEACASVAKPPAASTAPAPAVAVPEKKQQ